MNYYFLPIYSNDRLNFLVNYPFSLIVIVNNEFINNFINFSNV